MLLDSSRTVEGVVTVTSRESFCASPTPAPCVGHDGVGSGVGQVLVDLTFGALEADAGQWASAETLATVQVEGTVLPGDTHVEIPYSITLPDSVDGVVYQLLEFTTDVHGWHVNSGYASTDGSTTVNVPTLSPAPTQG